MKTNKNLDELRKAAEKEMFKFSLNEAGYTVDGLVGLGLALHIPNLIKFNQKVENAKILNVGGMPVLKFKWKKEVE